MIRFASLLFLLLAGCLSLAAHDGLARAVLPAHLPLDGDTMFAAATGKRQRSSPADLLELCHLATLVTARAIARGVFEAVALPYPEALPAWDSKKGGPQLRVSSPAPGRSTLITSAP